MTESKIEVLGIIYSHELSKAKRRIREKCRKGLEELPELFGNEYKLMERGLARYVRTIPDEVKPRLREMGQYDVIPLGKIMGMGEEEQ